MKNLKKIELTGGKLTAPGITELAQAFPKCLQLEEISLQDNWLKEQEMSEVIEIFAKVKKLKKIDLSHNEISPKTVLALAKRTTTCPNVTDLQIRADNIIILSSGHSEEIPRSSNVKSREKEKDGQTRKITLR
uniref:Uncharacterized protein n=1 Tax=Sphenodon punctatus TaxID=8508 RepID=A0A8D0GE40_SPHPU